jgi:hypothetical protein
LCLLGCCEGKDDWEVVAKQHMLEVVRFVLLLWLLVRNLGLPGVALAWTSVIGTMVLCCSSWPGLDLRPFIVAFAWRSPTVLSNTTVLPKKGGH